MRPYENIEKTDKYIIRNFPETTNSEDLLWHIDNENRLIKPLNENNWLIQLDNQLPQPIDKPIYIKKHQWHRLIKGDKDLNLKIDILE